MKYLGLDLGTKTLGLALSDKLGIIASPYKVLKFNNQEDIIDDLIQIIDEEKIDEIVLGLPKNMNNSLGDAANRSLAFEQILKKYINLPIHLVDERLSTKEAENYLISTDTSRFKRKKIIDAYAASIILETYLKKKE